MNRPDKRNALSTGLKQALMAHFQAAEADDGMAVVVLRGNGRTFCAGADIRPDPSKDDRKGDGLKTFAHHLWTLGFHFTPWELTKPVVASVQGHAMGAGCELAMMCDLTIAADSAVFGEPEIRFASVGSALVMPRIVGHKRARELLYLGDTIPAARAEESIVAQSGPGNLGFSLYTLRTHDIEGLHGRVSASEATDVSEVLSDEFGQPAFSFAAPDRYVWTVMAA